MRAGAFQNQLLSGIGGVMLVFGREMSTPVLVAAGLLLLCILLFLTQCLGQSSRKAGVGTGPTQPPVDYYDEETGEASRHSYKEIPPLTGKDGHESVVRAYYLNRSNSRELKYLEKYTPEAKAVMERLMRGSDITNEELQTSRDGLLIRKPQPDSPWIPEYSPEGQKIISESQLN
jgi:hypothetical protein